MTDPLTIRRHSPQQLALWAPWCFTTATALLLILGTGSVLRAQQFEDPPEVVPATASGSEQIDDHTEAVALFVHGRQLLQRGLLLDGQEQQTMLAAALRRFQRAWWFDPELVSILEDVLPLTFELKRPLERARYLILAAEREEVPLPLLEHVAALVADLEEFDEAQSQRALKLYQQLRQRMGKDVDAITMFQIGRLALTTGKFNEAAEAFAAVQKALDGKQEMPERLRKQLLQRPEATYGLFGESYLRAKQLDKAEVAFRKADEAQPDPAALAFRLALIAHDRGDKEQAAKLLEQYLDSSEKSAGLAPYLLLAQLIDGPVPDADKERADDTPDDETESQTQRKPSAALLKRLQELAQADANDALLGYYLASALRRAERWDEAEKLYQTLLQAEPAADGFQGLADIYRRRQQVAPLLEQLAAVVSETGALDVLEEVTDEIVGDRKLLTELNQLAEKLESSADESPPAGAWLALALLHAEAEQSEMVLPLLTRGLAQPIEPAGQAAVNLAFSLFQTEQPELAAEVFEQILDKKLLPGRSAEVHFYLAGAWTLAGDYDKGLTAAREAARLDPNTPRILAREPWVLYQAKRLPAARAKYVDLLDQFDADHTTAENREAMRDVRMVLSALDVELKNLESAEEWLLQTLDEFPENIGCFNDLGYLWADQGKHLNRALRMVQKASAAEPDNIAYLDSLGWALYRLGRFNEAVEPLEKAAADETVDGVILQHLGDTYWAGGHPNKARATWRKAAEKFQDKGDEESLKKVEQQLKKHAQQ